jgi:hypothetical protein
MKPALRFFRLVVLAGGFFSMALATTAATITSVATGDWSASAWPNTLRAGTISTATVSTAVTGSGTLFLTQIAVGNILKTTGNVVIGTVLSVNSNTSITLAANAASGNSAIAYNVQGVGSGDIALILGNTTITIDNAGAACASMSSATTGATGAWGVVFNAGSRLTVGGTFTVGGASRSGSVAMTSGGTLTCRALVVSNAGTWTPGAGTVELTAANTLPSTFFTSFNNLTILGGNTTTGANLTINGSLSIANGGSTSFTAAGFALTVNGTTTVGSGTSGSLTISSATGTKVFNGMVKISTGAFWTNSANAAIEFHGGITNSGTFAAGSGSQTFNTNDQEITGTFNIPSVTVTGATLTNTGTLTVTAALVGIGTMAQASNSTLNINFAGLPAISGLIANTTDNIVNYGFGGAQTVYPANYFNLILGNSGVKTLQAGTTAIDGDFTLNGTASTTSVAGLTIKGNVTTAAGSAWSAGPFTHDIGGNFTNGGSFDPGTGTIVFDGANLQAISNSGTAGFDNLDINSSGPGIQFENPFTVAVALAMKQGNMDLNGNVLTLGSSGANIGTLTYTAGTIVDQVGGGSFARWFNTSTVADGDIAGLFPVGTGANYNPLYLSTPVNGPTGSGIVTVAYTDANATTPVNVVDGVFTIVVRDDLLWTIRTSSGLAGGTYNLGVSGTNFGNVGSVSDLRLMLVNGVAGTAGLNSGTTASPLVTRTGLSLTDLPGPFYIGSTNATTSPLPVTWVSFTAIPVSGIVKLDWETAAEVNNARFTILRSLDAGTWENVTEVAASDNASLDGRYTAYDHNPYAGKSYYRLEQIDRDGKYSFSKTVSVTRASSSAINVYPNPATDYINIMTPASGKPEITLFNSSGQKLNIPVSTNTNYTRLDVSALPEGVYYIRIIQDGMSATKMVSKTK